MRSGTITKNLVLKNSNICIKGCDEFGYLGAKMNIKPCKMKISSTELIKDDLNFIANWCFIGHIFKENIYINPVSSIAIFEVKTRKLNHNTWQWIWIF